MALFEHVIKRPAFTVALSVGLATAGAVGVIGLGRSAPSTKPAVAATLIYAGAEAPEVERTLVNPLEARIASLPSVSKVESSARAGMATVKVWFDTEDDFLATSSALSDAITAVATQRGSRVGAPAIVRLDTDADSPSTASARELAPPALVAAALTLAIILMMLRSRSAAVIVASAVTLASAATLGVLRPAKLGWDAGSVVGLMLASVLIVDAAIRARDAFGRHLATGLQRRAAAQAAGVELSRSAAPVLFVAVTLFAAFALTDDNAIPFIRSIAIIAIAGTTSALLVATPIVLTMSSVRAGTPHGIRRRTFFTAFLYALEGCLDRVADRYHEMLAWTLDRRRVVPVVALGVAVLGIVVLHDRRAIVRSVDVVNTPPLMSADRTPISLAVRGPDWQTLLGVAQRIAEELRGSRGIAGVRVSAKPQDSADVTDVLTLSNDIYAANNQFASEDDPEIVAVSSPLRIDHLDGDRVVHIDADVTATTLEVLSNVTARLAAVPLPPQYRVSIGGALAERREASYGALRLLGVSCAIVTMVLAWHLRSTASVAAVVLTLGLTSLGAMASIVAARLRLDVFALLGGSAALALIAAHAIAAVDHARSRRGTAPSLRVLVIEAARVQFRPLLTTTLAAAATLGPLVRARGPGMELFATLGIAMLGGLVLGAIAVLFALPTFSIAIASHTRRTGG